MKRLILGPSPLHLVDGLMKKRKASNILLGSVTIEAGHKTRKP